MKYKEDPVFREVLGGFLRIDKLSSNTVKTFSGDRRYRGQKEKIDEICGNDERWLDWKYFALTMAIAWKDDQPENLHPLTSSLVMGVAAPLPILVQTSHVRERDLTVYISSAKFREIERKFFKPMQ